ncbi:hypothetical protein DFA_10237 [Cavenderia fasciculata]|uniref:Uncharacterized protein n=1 Tax=Cavenderia fasciculata TaxID=261658 RepID=F4Q9N3_CACFS|nr:uncharacterized protein DFA_10237 [Cavenderia fasciculata]EGG15402.1 hypothetical protein DFA_10237 [Cavenderia fasciculata]|eukprot:XP_004354144.1 hypothetical protein DFA_10237 [Cavenderia fasciculata]
MNGSSQRNNNNKNNWKDTSKIVAGSVSLLVYTIMSTAILLSGSKPKEREIEEERRKSERAIDKQRRTERGILNQHQRYSECMTDIDEFRMEHSDNYVADFFEGMAKEKRDEEINRINQCRQMTKDYWRHVLLWSEHCPVEYLQKKPFKVERYQREHKIFLSIVKPLDRNESQFDIYDPFSDLFNSS